MDGEESANLWYHNLMLRQYIVDHAKSLTQDEDLRADLMQEAWAAICEGADSDASEELLIELSRKAQDHYYRQQVPRQRKARGNKVLAVRLDSEHWYWVRQCQSKLRWPQPEVMRLIIERGTQSILAEQPETVNT